MVKILKNVKIHKGVRNWLKENKFEEIGQDCWYHKGDLRSWNIEHMSEVTWRINTDDMSVCEFISNNHGKFFEEIIKSNTITRQDLYDLGFTYEKVPWQLQKGKFKLNTCIGKEDEEFRDYRFILDYLYKGEYVRVFEGHLHTKKELEKILKQTEL